MSEDLQVAVVDTPEVVVVPLPSVEVLTETQTSPVIVETTEAQVAVINDEVHVVEQVESVVVVSVGEQGPPGSGGTETYTAGETVGGHRVLVTNAAGELIYADNTDPTHANQAMRISTGAAASGATVTVQVNGRITEPSWSWTPKASLYVGTSALMTETPPVAPAVFSKVVAVAETATRILMVNEPPVMLA